MNDLTKEQLITKNRELDSNNRLLIQQLKDCEKEKNKLPKIYEVVSSNKINETNYMKMMDWIKKVIKEEI